MEISLNLRFELVPPLPGEVYRTRLYGEPGMPSIRDLGPSYMVGNFAILTFGFEYADGAFVTAGGAVSTYLKITRDDITKLVAMQDAVDYTVTMKLNWLGLNSPAGRPYMNKLSGDYEKDAWVGWGPLCFAGQLIRVTDTRHENGEEWRKVVCFRKSDWGAATYQTRPDIVQRCSAAGKYDENIQNVLGGIYSPIWSPLDWDSTLNNRQKITAFWIRSGYLGEKINR